MIKPMVEKIAEEHNLKVVEVDIDNELDLVHQYGVQGVPTLILLDEGAHEIGRSVGLRPKSTVTASLGL